MSITAMCPTRTRRSSDLSKHSAEVFAEAEDHPVIVTRRDGDALVLMSHREALERSHLLDMAAHILTAILDNEGPLSERMTRSFPWMLALSREDRETCTQDLLDAARTSFATGQLHLASIEFTSWKETATAIAAGLDHSKLGWIDENNADAIVERP